MKNMTIGGATPTPDNRSRHIYCPSLGGLSARQADAAFLVPRMDQNHRVKDTEGHGHWAAAIAADPFGSNSAHFKALLEAGYTGVTNWPSSVLLEGHTQKQMAEIPATPTAEYAYLATAQKSGLDAMGFILTPDHAADALAHGVKNLALHPGILLNVDADGATMIRNALRTIISGIKRLEQDTKVYIYTSDWHDALFRLFDLECDGFVRFEETAT